MARIHKIAAEKSGEGYVILIAGDEAHPEIMGIRGHCSGESYEAVVYNTICSATSERQKEAAELAKAADIMIIVGGLHSSNTHKLKAICDEYCKCWLVEDAEGLRACDIDLSGAKFIGISAGASTPAYIGTTDHE